MLDAIEFIVYYAIFKPSKHNQCLTIFKIKTMVTAKVEEEKYETHIYTYRCRVDRRNV